MNYCTAWTDTGAAVPCGIRRKDAWEITVRKADIPAGASYIDLKMPCFDAFSGDFGYYVMADADSRGSLLCYFTEKENYEVTHEQKTMPIFGIVNKTGTYLGVVTGMRFAFWLNLGVADGKFHISPRFPLEGTAPYEDIKVEIYPLEPDAGFVGMGKKYRQLQLDRGNCIPLAEKCRDRPELQYAAESVEIRIRMGWKPAPPRVLEQTEENEPEMKVACTFDRVMDLVDELQRQGVDKAQLCLVGWNKSGHDGRWPDMFPVEPKLGGEEKLRQLIGYAQERGYQIICHTNSTDCYSISRDFSPDIVVKKPDQTLDMGAPYSGGNMYRLCPHYALEYARRDLPKVARLGFRGTHYIDVMTIGMPPSCHDPKHPLNAAQSEKIYGEIMALSHRYLGGFSSEGCNDFAAKYLDYGFYGAWGDNTDPFFDVEVPLMPIVYHGIFLYNPSTATCNANIKGQKSVDKLFAYGGRPSFYLYSRFLQGSQSDDWLGRDDLIIDTREQLEYTVSKIRELYSRYQAVRHTQFEAISGYTVTERGTVCTYSDGTVMETGVF